MIFEYVDIDYKESRLGVRFEPKNEDVAAQMVMQIPSELRFYHRDKRRWIIDPSMGPVVVGIIEHFLPDVPIQIEEKSKDVIISLLFGPSSFPDRVALTEDVQLRLGGPTIFQWRAMPDVQTRQQFAPNRNRTRS